MVELFWEPRSDSPPDGLLGVVDRPLANRQWRDRKRRAASDQPASQKQRHLLAPQKRRDNHPLQSMDQGRPS